MMTCFPRKASRMRTVRACGVANWEAAFPVQIQFHSPRSSRKTHNFH